MGKEIPYVDLNCENCGTAYSIRRDSYYHRKGKGRPNLCTACQKLRQSKIASDWYTGLSEEEKKERHEKLSNSCKNRWDQITGDAREEKLSALHKGRDHYQNNLTEEERLEQIRRNSEKHKSLWANYSDAEKKERIEALHEASKNYHRTLTEEDKALNQQKRQEGFRNWRNSLSEEDLKRESEMKRRQWADRSDELKKKSLKAMSDGLSAWRERGKDEMNRIIRDRTAELTRLMASMGIEEIKDEKAFSLHSGNYVLPDSPDNDSMIDRVARDLLRIGAKFECKYYNRELNEELVNNQELMYDAITGRKSSAFHGWNFMVETPKKKLLIDIDGCLYAVGRGQISVGGKDLSDTVRVNDFKRFYQTDGLPAYVIQAPSEKIDDNTLVAMLDVAKKEKKSVGSYKEFIKMLEMDSLTNKEINEIMQSE